mgnify:CR=1 FL=1
MTKKYELEIALEKLVLEFTRLVKDFRKFFFTIPKNKMDKIIYLMESIAWLLLGASLVLRIGRW